MSEAAPTSELGARFRKLRIVVSAFFGVLTLLLLVLWVRSYWRLDWIEVQRSGVYVNLSSLNGGICLDVEGGEESFRLFRVSSRRVDDPKLQHTPDRTFRFARHTAEHMDMWFAPHWFFGVIVATVSATAAAGRCKRFSLRTLLGAVTLVAVLLGTIMWLSF